MGTMTDKHDDGVDQVAQLLRLAGPREAVPPERAMRVRAAVRDEWRRHTAPRARTISIGWSLGALAAAALLLLGVRGALRDNAPAEAPAPAVAMVETVSGPLAVRVGDGLRAGSVLETGADGRAGVRTDGGASVRLDRNTRLQFVSAAALSLERGAVYIDSGSPDPGSIEVRTPFGVARDIGTRFEVSLSGTALRVRVRHGLVQLTRAGASHDATAGEELTLDEAGRLERRMVPVHGAEWAWAAALATPFELEGRSLGEFLDWICGENGWRLRFASAAVEQRAANATLHGSIQGLTPEEALAAVLPTTGVEYELANGVLTIRVSAETN
jgi:ferric-dicitrate binding protein FerR (iron transport regulator)